MPYLRPKPASPTAIVLGLTATGLAVGRELRGAGWTVIGVDDDRARPGCHSRTIDDVRGLSHLPLGLQLVDALLDFAQRTPGPKIVLPATDAAVQWCIVHRDTLVPHLSLSAGLTPERAGVMLDKARFGAACTALGIDVPETLQPESLGDARAFADRLGLPCIVKPRTGHLWRKALHGRKLLVANSVSQLERILTDIVGDPRAVVLQELIPGPESNLVVGAAWIGESALPGEAPGAVRHVLTARKIRQMPRDFGSASLVRTEDLPDVRDLSAGILARLDYRGLCGTEFKLDARTGRLRLIEINPRPTLWFDLCRSAGTHLIRAHAEDLAGLPAEERHVVQPQHNGVTWRYLVRDAIAVLQTGPVGVARALWQDRHRAPGADAVLAWHDPLASAAALTHAALQGVAYLRQPHVDSVERGKRSEP